MAQSSSRAAPLPATISGWRSIASYLGRGIRTVQRYERDFGLPVRRRAGTSGSVVAVKTELDEWIKSLPQRVQFSLISAAPDLAVSKKTMTSKLLQMQTLETRMLGLRREVSASMAEFRKSLQRVKRAQSKGRSGLS